MKYLRVFLNSYNASSKYLGVFISTLALMSIALHLLLPSKGHFGSNWPLIVCLTVGGIPLLWQLGAKLVRREFGSDILAGISILTSVALGEYLAGTLVVLMLSGGEVLERFAVRSASSALKALAARIPSTAQRRVGGKIEEIPVDQVAVGDEIVVMPHQICPVDGTVSEGNGSMDEAYLTGEPFKISKAPGSQVLSGAINGDAALTIRATALAVDSRYAKIMQVMREAEDNRPQLRRLGDQLGAWYTPVAIVIALLAWLIAGDPRRFLAVLVVATPCPLLIAIPVAIIGSVSLAAKRGIIIRDPSVLERIADCRTMILDKTGTLTYGRPTLSVQDTLAGVDKRRLLQLVASVERYSKHPLAGAIIRAAEEAKLALLEVSEIHEPPGQGLKAKVDGVEIFVTSRRFLPPETDLTQLPKQEAGLECLIVLDGKYVATYRFHDGPRQESRPFIAHLGKHGINRVLLVSGDREAEVKYLAELVGIKEVYGATSPEDKVRIVREENERAKTVFIGDGINDAPALATATVGIAFGPNSDVTSNAAGAVIMEASLTRVDEFFHIGARMRRIAIESAVGGMLLSIVAMFFAAGGALSPVTGALVQEVIDVVAILNALRASFPPKILIDFQDSK